VTTTQGQTLEERIREIETNIQQLQKDIGELKIVVDKLISQGGAIKQITPEGNKAAPIEGGFVLDMLPYSEEEPIGENLVIRKTKTGEKYITCSKKLNTGVLGRLELLSFSLKENFEVVVRADWHKFTQTILLLSEESEIRIDFKTIFEEHGKIEFGGKSKQIIGDVNDTGWIREGVINVIKLYINEGVAKLYINDIIFNSYKLENTNLDYKKLVINGIKEGDRLFEVQGKNL
jgi:hypothetical protein